MLLLVIQASVQADADDLEPGNWEEHYCSKPGLSLPEAKVINVTPTTLHTF